LHKTAVMLFFLSHHAFSQNEPIVTDRPDITESAVTVPLSAFQIETGIVYQENLENINGINTEVKTISAAGTLLRYGITSSVELRAGAEFLYQEAESPEEREITQGIGGIFAGSKIQLLRDHTELPDAAIFFHFNLPAVAEKLKPEKVEPEILLAASHTIFNSLSLSYNFGGTWESSDELINYFYSSSLGYELIEKTGMYAELFGGFSSAAPASFNFDAGLVYMVLDNLQLDISSGFNFEKPGENWFISSGFSLRLPE